jgi:hypothetical protein
MLLFTCRSRAKDERRRAAADEGMEINSQPSGFVGITYSST